MNDVTVTNTLDIVGSAIEKLLADGVEDGKIVSKEFLEWALDLPEPESMADFKRCEWVRMGRIDDFRERLLRQHRIALQTLYRVGYRIVPPADQSAFALEQAASGVAKAVSKASNILTYTRTELLSDEERRRHHDRANKLQSFAQFANEKTLELRDFIKIAH